MNDNENVVQRPTVSSEQVRMANEVLIRNRDVTRTARKFMRSSSAVKRAVADVSRAKALADVAIIDILNSGSDDQQSMIRLGELREREKYLNQML